MADQFLINSQWQSFVRYCAQNAKQGIVTKLDCGVTVCWTRSALNFLNAIFFSTYVVDKLDLCCRLEEIKSFVKKMEPDFPWVLFIEPEWLSIDLHEQLSEICSQAEFTYVSNIKCMQARQLLPPIRPLPYGGITFAASKEEVYSAALLNIQAYDMEASVAVNVVEQNAFVSDCDKQFCCTVQVDGKSVATATTWLLDECVYVALVATSMEYRKLGYAEVALRASIERALEKLPNAKHGIILHATDLGRTVYLRMGFKDISYIEMYSYNPVTLK